MTKAESSEQTSVSELAPSELMAQSDVIVFDMDGTLYLLDGDNNGFKNSTLNKMVLANTRKLIMEKEGASEEIAQSIVNDVLFKKEHLSIAIGNRYQLTREELFNITWDIDPQGILNNYENSQKVIKTIHQMGKQLILLTAAPQIWQKRVVKYLDLEKCFTDVYYSEQFKYKQEIFSKLPNIYPQKRILSVGDQYDTDIEPAESLGMSGFKVNHPDDLLLLISQYD